MGGGYDIVDGIVHAAVIGFEDLRGRGDLDYDDAVIRGLGKFGVVPIPEPSTILLLGAELVGQIYYRRCH